MRKSMAVAAGLFCLASASCFIASFFGLNLNRLGLKVFLLHAGLFTLGLPLIAIEKIKARAHRLSPRELNPERKPPWLSQISVGLFLLFVVVFFSFLLLSHAAMPDIKDGEYVLNSHGRITGYISEKDYFWLKAWELRLFASGWVCLYFRLMIDWWFPTHLETPWTVER